MIRRLFYIDWLLILAVLPLLIFGLLTMKSLDGHDYYFWRQLIWIAIGGVVFVLCAMVDWRGLKSSVVILALYGGGIMLLLLLAVIGFVTRGAQSWFYVGSAGVEPVELIKLFLVLLFAKYFSGRYVEIALWRHVIISFFYFAIPAVLVFLQPDFGSTMILLFIWVSMVLFAGMNMRQIITLAIVGIVAAGVTWFFLLQPYQRTRVITFLDPERDPRRSGYHAIQAMIAVGSGGVWGKGVGFGTQSRLHFLPEYQTDFIFAAFAEEWGLVGVGILFVCYFVLFWRILAISMRAPDNFAKLFGLGLSFLLISQILIHVGMNIGLLPVTGIGLPFMSYGGSFLVMLMAGMGILESIAIRSTSVKAYDQHEGVLD